MPNQTNPVIRRPIIGVMGSGKPMAGVDLAVEAGRLVAEACCHLLTGGGNAFMAAAARGFLEVEARVGQSLGILPATEFGASETAEGYPNDWVEIPIRTQLSRSTEGAGFESRNLTNILTADALVFLPGGPGTYHELSLAHAHERPRILYLGGEGSINRVSTAELSKLAPAANSAEALRAFLASISAR